MPDRWDDKGQVSPFKTPENYFVELPLRIREQIETKKQTSENPSIWKLIKPQLSLAASFFFLVLLGYFSVKLITDSKTPAGINQATVAEVLKEQPDMIDNYALLEAMDEEVMEAFDEPAEINTAYSDEIIDYLVESDIDIASIADEF